MLLSLRSKHRTSGNWSDILQNYHIYTKDIHTLYWKQLKCPSTKDWINKSQSIQPMTLIVILSRCPRRKAEMKTTGQNGMYSVFTCAGIYTEESGKMHRKMVAAAPTKGNGDWGVNGGKKLPLHHPHPFVPWKLCTIRNLKGIWKQTINYKLNFHDIEKLPSNLNVHPQRLYATTKRNGDLCLPNGKVLQVILFNAKKSPCRTTH